jgi:3-dehydroquinate dehydratase
MKRRGINASRGGCHCSRVCLNTFQIITGTQHQKGDRCTNAIRSKGKQMTKYANFNHDQLAVLQSQLESVMDTLERLGDEVATRGLVCIDIGTFTTAVAALSTAVQQARFDFVAAAPDTQKRKPSRSRRSKPPVGDFVCCGSNCRSRRHYARGLCRTCYTKISRQVRRGELCWDVLEQNGRAKPPQKETEKGSGEVISDQNEWDDSRSLDSAD